MDEVDDVDECRGRPPVGKGLVVVVLTSVVDSLDIVYIYKPRSWEGFVCGWEEIEMSEVKERKRIGTTRTRCDKQWSASRRSMEEDAILHRWWEAPDILCTNGGEES